MSNEHQYSYQVPTTIYVPLRISRWFVLTLSKSLIRGMSDGIHDVSMRYGLSAKLGSKRIWTTGWYVQTLMQQFAPAPTS